MGKTNISTNVAFNSSGGGIYLYNGLPTKVTSVIDTNGDTYVIFANYNSGAPNATVLAKSSAPTSSWTAILKSWSGVWAPTSKRCGGHILIPDSDGNLHVVRIDASANLKYSKTSDGGSTWDVDDEDSGINVASNAMLIGAAVYDGTLYVIESNTYDSVTALYVHSRTSGGSWTEDLATQTVAMWRPQATCHWYGSGSSSKLWCGGKYTSSGTYFQYVDFDMSTETFGTNQTDQPSATKYVNTLSLYEDDNGDLHVTFAADESSGYHRELWYGNNIGGSWSHTQLVDFLSSYHVISDICLNTDGDIYVPYHHYAQGAEHQYYKSTVARVTTDHTDWDSVVSFSSGVNASSAFRMHAVNYLPGSGVGCTSGVNPSTLFFLDGDSLSIDGSLFPNQSVGGAPWYYNAQMTLLHGRM